MGAAAIGSDANKPQPLKRTDSLGTVVWSGVLGVAAWNLRGTLEVTTISKTNKKTVSAKHLLLCMQAAYATAGCATGLVILFEIRHAVSTHGSRHEFMPVAKASVWRIVHSTLHVYSPQTHTKCIYDMHIRIRLYMCRVVREKISINMCERMRVCMCVCERDSVFLQRCVCVRVYVCTCLCVQKYVCVYISVSVSLFLSLSLSPHLHLYINMHGCVYKQMFTHKNINMYIYMYD